MKKILVLILVLSIGLFAYAETAEPDATEIPDEIHTVAGVISEIAEEGILIDTADFGPVLVKSDEETIIDASAEIAAGDYIRVDYDGVMSRSIPAQITADLIRMYSITGKIISADPEVSGVMLQTETHGEVYAFLPEPWLENTGETLKVYFDGAMTMSLPPQISGDYVISMG